MSVLESQVVQDPNPNPQTTPTDDITREPEGTQQIGNQRMVPVSALIEERKARQEAARERDRVAQENEGLKKVKENWDVVEPYLPLLASHPKITGKPQPQAAPAPEQDPELVKAAETLGFYTEDGRPDVTRAKAAKELFRGEARTAAEEVVRPVAQTAAATRAEALRSWAYTAKDTQGRPIAAREHIDAVLNELPVESRANPAMVQAALLIARGMGVPPAGEPLYTEGAGGAPGSGGKTLSGLERAAARARGLTDDQWIKARDNDSDILE